MTLLVDLGTPQFVERDPQQVVADMVSQYELMTGRTLYPAQVERLLVDLVAYRESLTREAIQDAALLNLVSFSRAPFLDYLGELLGCRRLGRTSARTLLRFDFGAPLQFEVRIPQGTRAQTADGRFVFATAADVLAGAGTSAAEAWAEAELPGTLANGIAIGQVSVLLDPVESATAANISIVYGGADGEDDERYRARVRLAAERPACGTLAAYRYHAMTAHQEILDVAVTSTQPGVVRLSALDANGPAADALLEALRAAVTRDDVRPLTDQVVIVPAQPMGYSVQARLTLRRGALAADVYAQALAAAQSLSASLARRLGADVVRSQIIERLQSVPGVHSVELLQPGTDMDVPAHEVAQCTAIDVTVAGVAND